jgi:hypothetical protein
VHKVLFEKKHDYASVNLYKPTLKTTMKFYVKIQTTKSVYISIRYR